MTTTASKAILRDKYLKLQNGSDIRGVSLTGVPGENLSLREGEAKEIAIGFIAWLSEKKGIRPEDMTLAIGRDPRTSGPRLLDGLMDGFGEYGCRVYDFGYASTPAMFMATVFEDFACDGTVMITASHLPYNRNGFKFFTREGGLNKKDITAILEYAADKEAQIAKLGEPPKAGQQTHRLGKLVFEAEKNDIMTPYCAFLKQRIIAGVGAGEKPLEGMKIVVDAGNGGGGFYATRVLKPLGADISASQFLEPDGMFPNHIPNPENEQAMASVSAAVVKAGADLGVIFDTDCDRAAIVDRSGREINRNRLIALISAVLLDKQPGLTIVTDSVTSSGLAQFIMEWGGEHYRYKRGYRNVIDEAKRLNEAGLNCPLAIETSGHPALRENHFLDDGMYLVTVLICEAMRLKKEGRELTDLIADLREPVESAEIRLDITAEDFRAAGLQAIEKVMDHAAFAPGWHIAPDNREGVRINFDLNEGLMNGWFLLRLSVHDPVLPLNIESDVPGGVKFMAEALLNVLDGTEGIDLSKLKMFIEKA